MTHGAYILARYSTDRQNEDSIEVQVEKCSAWCEKNNVPVLDIFADYATSGMKDTRPQYARMMEQLRQGGADTVVIYDQSRMFRKMTAWFDFRDEMANMGVRVVSATQPNIGGDLRDPTNFLTEGSMALFNQIWVLQTRQKVIEKMRYMARNGQHTGGTPPLGYQVQDGKLVIEESEAKTVRRIFAMYASGSSYREIIAALNADGIRTKAGNTFGSNSLHDLLKNKRYIGTITYGKTVKRPNGTRNTHEGHPDMLEIENGCPAIIDRETFDTVQNRLEANRHTGGRPPVTDDLCLRGKVFCGECGSSMSVLYSGGGRKYSYYDCAAKKRQHTCTARPIRAYSLESTIAKAIREHLGQPGNRDELIEILREQRNSMQGDAGAKMEALYARRKKVDTQLENAANAILQGLTSPTLAEKVRALEAEKAQLDHDMQMLHDKVNQTFISDEGLESALGLILGAAKDTGAAVLSIVYRVEVCEDVIRVWTLLDCTPGADTHGKISIPTNTLPSAPASGVCAELLVLRQRHQKAHAQRGVRFLVSIGTRIIKFILPVAGCPPAPTPVKPWFPAKPETQTSPVSGTSSSQAPYRSRRVFLLHSKTHRSLILLLLAFKPQPLTLGCSLVLYWENIYKCFVVTKKRTSRWVCAFWYR